MARPGKCHDLLHEGFLQIDVVDGAFAVRDARHRPLHEWRTCAFHPSGSLSSFDSVAVTSG